MQEHEQGQQDGSRDVREQGKKIHVGSLEAGPLLRTLLTRGLGPFLFRACQRSAALIYRDCGTLSLDFEGGIEEVWDHRFDIALKSPHCRLLPTVVTSHVGHSVIEAR